MKKRSIEISGDSGDPLALRSTPSSARSPAQRETFKAFQSKRQEERLKKVNEALAEISKSGASYRHLTDLAKAVAAIVSKKENKSCAASTLLRNLGYRAVILRGHEQNHRGKVPGLINSSTTTSPRLLDNEALREELKRITAYAKRLENEALLGDVAGTAKDFAKLRDKISTLLEDQRDLGKAIGLLVKNFEGILSFASKSGDIVDLSKKVGSVVVPAHLIKSLKDNNEEGR